MLKINKNINIEFLYIINQLVLIYKKKKFFSGVYHFSKGFIVKFLKNYQKNANLIKIFGNFDNFILYFYNSLLYNG